MSTIISDKINVTIKDTGTFNALEPDDQIFVEEAKKAMIEIFPVENNMVDEKASELAENFAFVFQKSIKLYVNKLIDLKIQ